MIFEDLSPGTYTLEAQLNGFDSLRRGPVEARSDRCSPVTLELVRAPLVNDEIVAVAIATVVGGFNVITSDWIDINLDGRAWAAEPST